MDLYNLLFIFVFEVYVINIFYQSHPTTANLMSKMLLFAATTKLLEFHCAFLVKAEHPYKNLTTYCSSGSYG